MADNHGVDDQLTRLEAERDALRRLWDSTADLYREHDVYPPLLSAQAVVLEETVDTLLYQAFHDDSAGMVKAAAAVLVSLVGLLMALGVEYAAFAAAVEKETADDESNAPQANGDPDDNYFPTPRAAALHLHLAKCFQGYDLESLKELCRLAARQVMANWNEEQ